MSYCTDRVHYIRSSQILYSMSDFRASPSALRNGFQSLTWSPVQNFAPHQQKSQWVPFLNETHSALSESKSGRFGFRRRGSNFSYLQDFLFNICSVCTKITHVYALGRIFTERSRFRALLPMQTGTRSESCHLIFRAKPKPKQRSGSVCANSAVFGALRKWSPPFPVPI